MSMKILIADDEYFIRQRIKRIIHWEDLGLELSGEAENGLEVLELMEEQPADIILLDIRMPKMLGTDVALHIKERFPFSQVIILSGYNEFEYARSALQHGVSDYLLKPIDGARLNAAIQKCMHLLSEKKTAHENLKRFYHNQKCIALADMCNKKISLPELCRQYPELTPDMYSVYIGVYSEEDTAASVLVMTNTLRAAGLHCEYIQESNHIYVVQLFFHDTHDICHLGSILTSFIADSKAYHFLTTNDTFLLQEDWAVYYRRVTFALGQRFFSPHSEFFLEYSPKETAKSGIDLLKLRQTVTKYLNLNDAKQFKQFIEVSFSDITLKRQAEHLYSFINELFITYYIYYKIPTDLESNIPEFISSILEEEHSLECIKASAIHYGLLCMKYKKTAPSDVRLSKKIVAYIYEHYSDPQLTVASIAEHFQLNPSYMGTVFKNVKHQSVLQHITKIRLEAAKELLETDQHLVSEVSYEVGYADVFYFSKSFKKNYGYSPKEYIRNCEDGEL